MPKRSVLLTEHQEKVIEKLVETGRYQDASDVVREGLRLVEERESGDVAKLDALRQAVRVGIDALDRGDYKQFDSIDDLEHYLRGLSDRVIEASRS
jgi:antitoxin ParD1/3/4